MNIAVLGKVVVGVLSVKVAFLTAGYVAYVVAAKTAEKSRASCLDHARHVVEKASEDGSITEEECAAFEADLAILQTNIESGWRTPEEVLAFGRVMRRGFIGDTRATGAAMREFGGNCLDEIRKSLEEHFPARYNDEAYFS